MTTTITTSPYVLKQLLTYSKAAPVAVDPEWARLVTSAQDIPDEFYGAIPETADFPYTLYVAEESGSGLLKKRPAQLLSLYRDHLIVREVLHGEVATNGYPLQAVTAIEHGRLLLHSWLTIAANSSSASAQVRFNTVTEQLFAPVIQALRSGSYQPAAESSVQNRDPRELAKLSYLWSSNMEYFHTARASILPGTKILGSVYQPEQQRSKRQLFRSFGKSQEFTGHVAILTARDLILISRRHPGNKAERSVYGTVTSYFPMSQIQHVSFQKLRGLRDWAMEITLFDYTWKRVEFASDTAINLAEFQAACRDEFGSRTN